MARTLLDDEQWLKLRPILKQVGIYYKPTLRMTLEGIFYRLRVGCPWRDTPAFFGKWATIYKQFNQWSHAGKLPKLLSILKNDSDMQWLFIDGSIVKVHQHGTGASRSSDEAIGKNVAGNTSKIHLAVDSDGNPCGFKLTGGQVHDSQMACELINSLDISDTDIITADKGYTGERIANHIHSKRIKANIPNRNNSLEGNQHMDWYMYKLRHLVENAFAKLKQYRALATRYDKLAKMYENTVILACILIWLPLYQKPK